MSQDRLKLNIRGFNYTIVLLTSDEFSDLHGPDTEAICLVEPYELVFKRDCINKQVIIHELTHAYINGSLLSSSDITALQMEEVICEIMAHFLDEIIEYSDTILKYLKNS